jgi:hypothetical protein
MAKAPATASFPDYGGYIDMASSDDLLKCYEIGGKAGTVQAIRQYATQAWRTLIPIEAGNGNEKMTCAAGSNLPATVRFMFFYDLKDATPATCKLGKSLNVGTGGRLGFRWLAWGSVATVL